MKKIHLLLTIILYQLYFAQLDKVHYLQPLVFGGYNSTTITEEFIYLSTPSTLPITVNVKMADGSTIPRLAVYAINAQTTTNITTGIVTLSNTTPVRLSLINTGNVALAPGTSPVTLATERAGTIIPANIGGLILESDNDFFVNYRGRSIAQAGSVLTKGKAALGKTFHWGGTPNEHATSITDIGSMLSIMATENNTSVTISNIKAGTQFINGSNTTPITATTITRTLQKGQSFILFARIKNNQVSVQDYGWLGAKVTSTKDIAVTVGGLMQQGSTGVDNRDIAVDQLVPVDQIGNEYVIMQGNGGTSEKIIVIATENNTTVNINGSTTPNYTLANVGDYISIPGSQFVTKNMYIKTNKSTYVFHKIFGSSALNTNSFMFIPPLSCFGQNTVDMIPDSRYIGSTEYANTELAVLSAGGIAPTVTLNGGAAITPITSATGVAVQGNSNWKTFRYDIGSTAVGKNLRITSTGTIQAELIGADSAAGFGGYFSGFGTKPVVTIAVQNSPTDRPCTGDTGASGLDLSATAGLGTYQWYKNGLPIAGATSALYTIPAVDITPSEYNVVVTAPGGCLIFSNIVKSYACPCYKTGTIGTPEPTNFGISTRIASPSQNWPKDINNGFISLDSNDKGMVITRMNDPEITITDPIKGMLVYDNNDNCLKIYDGTGWKCINQTCN